MANIVLIAFAGVVVDFIQSQQHLRGIIGVRVELVIELEIPAARLRIPYLHRPIALVPHFLGEHPVSRLQQPRIRARNSRLAQRIDRIRGVPHRRHAGLHAEGWLQIIRNPFLLNAQLLKLIHRPNGLRIIHGVAQAAQRKNRIEHGRINGAQAVTHLQAFQDPLLRFADRDLAQRPDVHPFGPMKQPVHHQEEVPPADYLLSIPTQVQLGIGLAADKELIDASFRRQFFEGLFCVGDGKRHQDGARPGRNLVNVEVAPVGKKD